MSAAIVAAASRRGLVVSYRLQQPFRWPRTADKYVYHYTKAETALTKILATKTIRAGRFTTMNDPREAKRWVFDSPTCYDEDFSFSSSQLPDFVMHRANVAASYIRENLRVVAFSRDDFGRKGSDDESPLGRGFGLPSMWAHYGRLHTGVCLVFDRVKLENQVQAYVRSIKTERPDERFGYWPGAVVYEDRSTGGQQESQITEERRKKAYMFEPEDGFFAYDDDALHREAYRHVCKHYPDLVLEKGRDWSYENEYRWVFWDERPGEVLINFGDALAGIVVGEDFGSSNELGSVALPFYESMLKRFCSELKVKAHQLVWLNGYVHLDPFFGPKENKFKYQIESQIGAYPEDSS